MSLPDAIAEYLGSAVDGLAYSDTTDEGNVFVDASPSTPDRCVTVYSAAGPEADSKLPYDPAQVQVVCRGDADVTWAREMSLKVYGALHGLRNAALPGGVYVVFVLGLQSSPFNLGDDENGRPQYAIDYRTEVLNPTTARETL